MIGINSTIFDHFRSHRKNYPENLTDSLVEEFISFDAGFKRYEDRQCLALQLIGEILGPHQKKMMTNHLAVLSELELKFNPYDYSARDHVIHAVLTYFLGVYLADLLAVTVDDFQWKLAALLHDIGYPLEKLPRHCGLLEKEINAFGEDLQEFQKVSFNRKIEGLERLFDSVSSFTLITSKLAKFGFKLRSKEVFDSFASKDMDHGVVSGLILLKCIDTLYHKNNPSKLIYMDRDDKFWSYDNFTIDILDSATSIFLHNLKPEVLPSKFNLALCPLAFLLRLTDELQDWERIDNQAEYYTAANYALDFNPESRSLTVTAPQSRIDRIKQAMTIFSDISIDVQPSM